MKVKIEFKKYINEQNIKTLETSFLAYGIYNDYVLTFIETDKTVNKIYITNDKIVINRKNQEFSCMEFSVKEKTLYKNESKYGTLLLSIKTLLLTVSCGNIYIKYQIMDENNANKYHELKISYSVLK